MQFTFGYFTFLSTVSLTFRHVTFNCEAEPVRELVYKYCNFDKWLVLIYAVVSWSSKLGATDAKSIEKLMRKAKSILGVLELDLVEEVVRKRMLHKLLSTVNNTAYLFHSNSFQCFKRRIGRIRPPKVKTKLHNNLSTRWQADNCFSFYSFFS